MIINSVTISVDRLGRTFELTCWRESRLQVAAITGDGLGRSRVRMVCNSDILFPDSAVADAIAAATALLCEQAGKIDAPVNRVVVDSELLDASELRW